MTKLGATLAAVCALGVAAWLPAAGEKRVDFSREIRPILSDNCFFCHGPDEKTRMVGLRLDTREGAFEVRGNNAVIVPGSRQDSRLYQRLIHENAALRMPPAHSGKKLTEAQIELIGRWIDEGAPWEEHWAFVPPKRWPLPETKQKNWARNAIDHFVLARLEKEGLKPSPEADKVTLARRAYLDITGIPPTPEKVDAFLADKSPDAYEKLVDKLLDTDRHAERLAMVWLDLARYADTHGYHIDSHRDMWPWRDWVIRAFRQNMPFDRFTIEQIAGDLLPGATRDQITATGFNRNHMINYEGGAIPEEYLVEYVVDRVETTSTVWLGLTMGCARCHDHKYDPISQKEFYRFFAFFNTIAEKGLDGRAGNAEPVLPLPDETQRQKLIALNEEICAREEALPGWQVEELQREWEKSAGSLPEATREGLIAHWDFDDNLSDSSGGYRHARLLNGEISYGTGQSGKAAGFNTFTRVSLGRIERFNPYGPFTVALWVRPGGWKDSTILYQWPEKGKRPPFLLYLDDSVVLPELQKGSHLGIRIGAHSENAIVVETEERLPRNRWHHLTLTYDGSGKAEGLRLFVGGEPAKTRIVKNALRADARAEGTLEIGYNKELEFYESYRGSIDDLRVYLRPLRQEEAFTLAVHHPVRQFLLYWDGKRSKEQSEALRDYFLTYAAPERMRVAWTEKKELERRKKELEKEIPTVMVMREDEKPRETFVLKRGAYNAPGEKVEPGTPSVLPPLPNDAEPNRLGLAKWLVSPGNPLTARVMMNRFWQIYFGHGLVRTAENFGSQAEAPTHPELLDWLATEFIESGWDVRAMQRLILTSATYRQSSKATPELLERDPENRLLARGARFRLPAETVRDNALAASGLLVEKVGGPSVFPYQPKGVWEEIAYGDVYSAQTYVQDHGENLYRRSMYTFWKRTAPPPALATFDAPDREKCTARRPRTNTPLQALVLMNDPTFVEAARALAQRMILEAGRDHGKRIEHGFRLAVARKPTPRERQWLRDLAEKHTSDYRKDPQAAEALISVGESKPDPRVDKTELAAWTTVASVILNLDETITRE
jgi:hypothetical protein